MAGGGEEAEDGPRLLLGYWAIRGLGQPIRLLLEHVGLPYAEKRYHIQLAEAATAEAPAKWDRSEWYSEKHDLSLAFPNLPYLLDRETGLKLTQTNAILFYVADLAGGATLGKSIEERATVHMLLNFSQDVRARSMPVPCREGPRTDATQRCGALTRARATTRSSPSW